MRSLGMNALSGKVIQVLSGPTERRTKWVTTVVTYVNEERKEERVTTSEITEWVVETEVYEDWSGESTKSFSFRNEEEASEVKVGYEYSF